MIVQSHKIIVVSVLATNWIEVIASVIGVVAVLVSIDYWRTVELDVSRYFIVF